MYPTDPAVSYYTLTLSCRTLRHPTVPCSTLIHSNIVRNDALSHSTWQPNISFSNENPCRTLPYHALQLHLTTTPYRNLLLQPTETYCTPPSPTSERRVGAAKPWSGNQPTPPPNAPPPKPLNSGSAPLKQDIRDRRALMG